MKVYLVKCYNKYWGTETESHIICGYINLEDATKHCEMFNSDPLYRYFVGVVECYDHLKQFGE